MKHIGVMGLALALAVAVIAVTAASASANPEFDAALYPVEWKGTATNIHAFSGGGVVIACRKATLNTNEDAKTANPKKNSPALKVHPIYTECRGSVGPGQSSFPVEARTTGCDYKLHAVPPGKPEGSLDIECETGKEIEYQFLGLTGCIVRFKPQSGLKNLEYTNEPKAGTPTQEVTTEIEANKIKSKANSACGLAIGEAEFEGEYRQGKIGSPIETAELEPPGHPATVVFQGFAEATKAQEALEVGINEPHWYENHVAIAKQSGGPGEEGTDSISWGKLVLTTVTLGVIECENEFGGDLYNPEGAGRPPAGGMARAGEGKLDAFAAYDCTNVECETTLNSKESITPEGLGVAVEGGVAKALEWEGKLLPGTPTRAKIGNTILNSPTQIKFHILCPKTTSAEQNSKAKGELTPEVENGTSIGSAPSKIIYGAGSGELEIGAAKEGKVTGSLKAMGYEGGELITSQAP